MPTRAQPSSGPIPRDVLVVEDDANLRRKLVAALVAGGLSVAEASCGADALRSLNDSPSLAIVSDLNLPDGDALALLPRFREAAPSSPVFIITAYGSVDIAVRAVKAGAEDFFTKPVDPQMVLSAVQRVVDERAKPRPRGATKLRPFESSSPAMLRIEDQVDRLQDADCSVLLLGETGVGKSMLARRIHAVGARTDEPFVDVNCAGLSRELVESELFGHERGAFTGAQATKQGLFDAANGGTLFLDEIGDIDLSVQPKILKVLEEKRFRRVGDVRERAVDVRLLAATHVDLVSEIAEKRFRADLYYRISTVSITVPPLRDRTEDIIPLARYMLDGLGLGHLDIADDARTALLDHEWPGNLRELKNVIERSALLRSGDTLRAPDLQFDKPTRSGERPRQRPTESMKDLEREHIVSTLMRCDGNVDAASRALAIPRSTLYQKLRLHQIDAAAIREEVRRTKRGA